MRSLCRIYILSHIKLSLIVKQSESEPLFVEQGKSRVYVSYRPAGKADGGTARGDQSKVFKRVDCAKLEACSAE